MKIFIGSNHKGTEIVDHLVSELSLKYEVYKTKTLNYDNDMYPDYAIEVGQNVANNKDSFGIIFCGNGIGMSIVANKIPGVRCAKVNNVSEAIASRNINDANVIALGVNYTNHEILNIINNFIMTPFSNNPKYIECNNKIIKLEKGEYNEL